jgi:hypothetical protein
MLKLVMQRERLMTRIILSDEQTKVVAAALEPVPVCDSRGYVLGYLNPVWTKEDVVEAKKTLAADEPWYTTEQVLEHLRSLVPPSDPN